MACLISSSERTSVFSSVRVRLASRRPRDHQALDVAAALAVADLEAAAVEVEVEPGAEREADPDLEDWFAAAGLVSFGAGPEFAVAALQCAVSPTWAAAKAYQVSASAESPFVVALPPCYD